MFFVHIFFFCGNVSRLDHVDQVNFAYLNSELSRKKKREAEGDAREIKFSQMGWVLCSTNWFWQRDSHLWDEVWRLRACRANMWWSVVVFESDVMDMLMSVKDLPNTCQGLNHRFFTWLQHLLLGSENLHQFIDQNVLFAAEKMLIFWFFEKELKPFHSFSKFTPSPKHIFWRNQEHHSRWWRLPTKILKKQLKKW